MQRAGRAALEFLRARWPDAHIIRVYCGAGNNAGDGYVVAALARQAGLRPHVIAVVEPDKLAGDAGRAVAMARAAGVPVETFPSRASPAAARPDLLVDALLGTGLTRDVGDELADAVAEINASAEPVLALDVPTGLDSDSGAVRGVVVHADATMTFVGLKSGLFLGSGPDCRGALGFSDLDLPRSVFAGERPVLRRIAAADRALLLEPRSRTTHKGMNGRVLVVGGSDGMSGAARLAAEAALRAGAGLVHVAAAPSSVDAIMAGRPEIMCRGVTDSSDFDDWVEAADVIVVGPGLGRSPWSESLAAAMLKSKRPLVVDADALNYLAAHPGRNAMRVLTPHPGEASRLLDRPVAAVQAARDAAVTDLVETFGGIAVLKGACSLVAAQSEEGLSIAVCDAGNPGMASGGMGDVLSGVVGGLIAQFGCTAPAVEAAVLVHAMAGDEAARDGERGLLASDLMAHIRRGVNPA